MGSILGQSPVGNLEKNRLLHFSRLKAYVLLNINKTQMSSQVTMLVMFSATEQWRYSM